MTGRAGECSWQCFVTRATEAAARCRTSYAFQYASRASARRVLLRKSRANAPDDCPVVDCFAHAVFAAGRVVWNQQAPELVQCDRGEREGYSKAVDVWGVGLIAFIMLFGYNPFLRESNMETHEAIVKCNYCFPKDDNVSAEAKDLIRNMVCLSVERRITIEGALQAWRSTLSAALAP
eukprot:2416407-Pleurochrysis_carterae.AAC.1